MTRHLSVLFLAVLVPGLVFAQISASGFGKTRDEARQEALADLSNQISVNVQTSTVLRASEKTGKGFEESYTRDVLTRSELPVLGAKFEYKEKGTSVECVATLDKSALSLYETELKTVLFDASKISQTNEIAELSQLLSLADQYAKYRLVMAFLGTSGTADFPVSRTEVEARFEKKAGDIGSLEDLVKIATLLFKESGYYVFPPEAPNSKEITPFAATVRDRLSGKLATVSDPSAATYKLVGNYVILENGVELTYRAISEAGLAKASASFRLKPSAYEGLRLKPETQSLEALMQQDLLLTNELRAEISTNRGKNNLLFKGGETMKVMVKLNKPGYIYMVGHTQAGDEKFSYLIPVGDGQSKRDFVLLVNADDANKWIEIGEFDITPPFGTETMQVFASNKDIVDQIPDFYFDKKGYAVIGKNPEEVTVKTRAALKKKGTGQTKTTEAVITFTTVK